MATTPFAALSIPGVFASVVQGDDAPPLVELRANTLAEAVQPCWVPGGFSRELCCRQEVHAEECAFDPFVYTKKECCTNGVVIVDPYQLTAAPTLRYPEGHDWEEQHPANAADQLEWESLVSASSVVRTVASPVGEVKLRVFKGDMTDVSLYGLDAKGRHANDGHASWAPARIVDAGGNYGGTAIALAQLFPQARVVVLEPNPLLCRFALWNLRAHGLLARSWLLCAGLGTQDGALAMQTCRQPWIGATVNTCINLGMRTFPSWPADGARVDSEQVQMQRPQQSAAPDITVPMVSMRSLLNGMRWRSRIDLLKIDCEGCEWQVLGLGLAASPAGEWWADWLVGELHFDCGATACWPPRASAVVGANCTGAISFNSRSHLLGLLLRCAGQRQRAHGRQP